MPKAVDCVEIKFTWAQVAMCFFYLLNQSIYLDSSYTRSPAYKLLITAQFRKAVWYYRTGPTLVHVGLGLRLCPTAPTANPIPPGLQQNDAIYWRSVQMSSHMEPKVGKIETVSPGLKASPDMRPETL